MNREYSPVSDTLNIPFICEQEDAIMKPSYTQKNSAYLPAIVHPTGRVEILYGVATLLTIHTALKYARFEIQKRKTALALSI